MRDSIWRSLDFLLAQRALDLGAFHGEHAAQLDRRYLVVEQRAYLLERQAKLLERQNAVEQRQLPDAVITIAGLRVGMGRTQQTELVVEPQLASGDLGDLGEFTDTKHLRSPECFAIFSSGCN